MMDDLKSKLVGGAVVLVLGGTSFAVSQSDIASNFAEETGMSQEQAQQYVDESQDDLDTFANAGKEFVDSGKLALSEASSIDCTSYVYEWEETSNVSCAEGKSEVELLGNKEIKLGECFQALDTNIGSSARAKINECIDDIDSLNISYDKPVVLDIYGKDSITESKNNNLYNKSVLRAALESE